MIHFVTIVSADFWPGFAALVQSLAENSALDAGEYEIQVICDLEQAPHRWIETRNERISLLALSTIPNIALLSPQEQGRRMETAMQKLGVFALPEAAGPRVYIDSDMVCLGSLRELLEMPAMAAACDDIGGFDTGKSAKELEQFEINTGLLVFQPSATDFAELLSVYERRHGERRFKGDQDIINMWLQDSGRPVRRLGSEWNFSKRFQDQTGARWIKERIGQIKILHFVGAKPWYDNRAIKTFRECHYRWMEEIWWDFFERSGFAAHMAKPPARSTAWKRAWLLPWTSSAIRSEHWVRANRLLRRLLFQNK